MWNAHPLTEAVRIHSLHLRNNRHARRGEDDVMRAKHFFILSIKNLVL